MNKIHQLSSALRSSLRFVSSLIVSAGVVFAADAIESDSVAIDRWLF